jgi:hypothetical protein
MRRLLEHDYGEAVGFWLMSEPPGNSGLPAVKPSLLKLGRWSRASAIVLGLAGLGAGGVAVFVTHLEAGPVALIAAGLIFVLVGMGGRIPNRLKVGESEAAWEEEREAVQGFVRDVAERSSGSQRPQIIGALADLAGRAPGVAAPAVKAIAYEEMVLSMLGELHDKSQASESRIPAFNLVRPEQSGGPASVDALLVSPEGYGVAVEVKSSYEGSAIKPLSDTLEGYSRLKRTDERATVLLLVMADRMPSQFLPYLAQQPYYIFRAEVRDQSDIDELTQAVQDAFMKAKEIAE